ncbi:hypothetical protein ASG87_09825 [Frateuria sp. Soil773]|uniref:hypothetical protein n=1 Tax=Frateuria sp. Soil773 TaxID=1736407 RepID=UPI0006F878B0|nr:hypothetical protein [Frateuria sp. Soil773]KRF01802.1 hypothetical protein ASG87_09825 [Frateuria sp. Soil773]
MPTATTRADRHDAAAWYRQPVLWLGAAIFAASLAGCVWMIVLGARHADAPVDAPHAVFGVPAASHSSPGAAR